MDPIEFTVSARYYSRGAADWSLPQPAEGFNGSKTKSITLRTTDTALACMHVLNYGHPDGPSYLTNPNSPAYVHEIVHRTRTLIQTNIAPLVLALRAAGMRIMHLLGGIPAAENYSQYQSIHSRIPEPESRGLPPVAHPEWRREFIAKSLGNVACEEDVNAFAIAPELRVASDDWVVTSSPQAATLLRENNIWNLLLVGFDTYGCMITSPGGVLDMSRLGYRCFVVEDCTNTNETSETRLSEEASLKRAALETIELLGYGYTVQGSEIRQAVERRVEA